MKPSALHSSKQLLQQVAMQCASALCSLEWQITRSLECIRKYSIVVAICDSTLVHIKDHCECNCKV